MAAPLSTRAWRNSGRKAESAFAGIAQFIAPPPSTTMVWPVTKSLSAEAR
jgi:hypothetical protein